MVREERRRIVEGVGKEEAQGGEVGRHEEEKKEGRGRGEVEEDMALELGMGMF